MKSIILFLVISIFVFSCKQSETKIESKEQSIITYNDSLAKKVGTDQYGMKKFVIAFLKRGPNRNQDSITSSNVQRAHMDNITELAHEGKLVLAGPFFGNDDLRGIYVFDVQSIEVAQALTATYPALKAGSLVMELKEWYGSTGLVLLNDLHKQITKTEIKKKSQANLLDS